MQAESWKHFQCTFPSPPHREQCKEGTWESRLKESSTEPSTPTTSSNTPAQVGTTHTFGAPELPARAAEHTANLPHHRNNSTHHCHSPLPSSPSSPASPSTTLDQGLCPMYLSDLTRYGHKPKSHTSANLEIQVKFAGSSHSTVSQTGHFAAALQSLHRAGHAARIHIPHGFSVV